jgi:polyisoprenoid-binding protein YceI
VERKKVEKTGDDDYKIIGDLTIRGTTKEVALDVELTGGLLVGDKVVINIDLEAVKAA